jgi:hypothetical protein
VAVGRRGDLPAHRLPDPVLDLGGGATVGDVRADLRDVVRDHLFRRSVEPVRVHLCQDAHERAVVHEGVPGFRDT